MNTTGLSYPEYLRRRDQVPAAPRPRLEPSSALLPAPRRLPEFMASDAVVHVDAPVLGEGVSVLLAGERADVRLWRIQHPDVDNTVVAFRGSELTALLEVQTADGLRMLHEAKAMFGGWLLADGEPLREVGAGRTAKTENARGKRQ